MIKGRNTGGIQNGELSQKNGALLPEKQEQGHSESDDVHWHRERRGLSAVDHRPQQCGLCAAALQPRRHFEGAGLAARHLHPDLYGRCIDRLVRGAAARARQPVLLLSVRAHP